MHITKPLILIASLLSASSALAVGDANTEPDVAKVKRDIDTREAEALFDVPLAKRACKSNGCKCAKVKQGQYCGMCDAVTVAGTGGNFHTDIYECNPQGGCCWYGPSSTCAGSDAQDKTHCPN
ncbi:hypothetical protein JX265_007441 [Neoarthrinium moseri]|uniref:Uncharacterized protein n=1 Tax=Neoarthrinium moseri TaxID=1658444 RepID=A0A9P9WKA6_9PEZI|nr:uncharacterized protein JN550_009163 [Neoarthrinium moseri]KAI1841410.1 hypothetical protein JX266_012421 [Neoarthrinium moseri]KAI1864143.1 hypothetical protein JN550_009163 [Neoarthrinium moseri]KAI1867639.1 hypothetical protein JX265_007441 [Neoarthrinium moseri]